MAEKNLHIITHDVPYPADFGGVVDQFYKIKTLHEAGVKLYLHCFVHHRPPQVELEQYCERIYYYTRHANLSRFSFRIPFIVNSRKSSELIDRLSKDNFPILIEAVHCSYYLFTGQLGNRIVVLRLHNAEFEYYRQLSLHEKNYLKKWYYQHESRLLKIYEQQLTAKATIAAVSGQDVELYRHEFAAVNIVQLPVFIPYKIVSGKPGKGCFCLYHGNLSINENEEAATWLLKNVFGQSGIPFVIAGKNPSRRLTALAHKFSHTCLVANPGDKELQDMIAKAQVNVLPSMNNTGVKLKLLNALFNGRHCLLNKAGVEGSGLHRLCQVAEDADEFRTAIGYLYDIPYTAAENEQRQLVLNDLYNNQKNLEKMEKIFWPGEKVYGG